MSREIKVRVAVKSPHWDRDAGAVNGWFVSTNSFTIGEFWDHLVELKFKDGGSLPFGDIDWETDTVEYLEYTGLKDKNGEEIYEGDIVKDLVQKCIAEVKWDDGWGGGFEPWSPALVYAGRPPFADPEQDCEVIGNRFENPNLLEQAA